MLTTQTRTYDSRYRIQRNTLTRSAGVIADYTYTEDAVGNITSIHDMTDATYNRDFAYDDLNRVITASTGSSLWGPGNYTYDAMGNMLSRDLGKTIELDPNDPNNPQSRRFSAHSDALPAPGSIHETFAYTGTTSKLATVTFGGIDHPITYDAAGNELGYFDPRAYSPRNLMTSIVEPSEDNRSHTVRYSYDGRGVRVVRSEGVTGGTFANRYSFYTPELQLLAISVDDDTNVYGKRGISTFTPWMKHEIAWFNGRPIAQLVLGSTAYFNFTDHLGTPILQTDATGAIKWRAEYEPYGDIWTMRPNNDGTIGSPADQPLRFPGQEYAGRWEGMEERYNIFRWYRAGWGRYTTADPIGLIGGLNLFAYAKSNPLLYVDPFGREAARTCCKGGKVDVCVVQNLIEPAMQCVIEHEKQHVEDIQKWMPCNQCRYRPEGANIGGDQDLKDWGAPPEAAAATECAGYRREYECLKKNRNLAPNPGMVDRRLDQIKEFLDRNYPSCFAGQTWR